MCALSVLTKGEPERTNPHLCCKFGQPATITRFGKRCWREACGNRRQALPRWQAAGPGGPDGPRIQTKHSGQASGQPSGQARYLQSTTRFFKCRSRFDADQPNHRRILYIIPVFARGCAHRLPREALVCGFVADSLPIRCRVTADLLPLSSKNPQPGHRHAGACHIIVL